jgi:hypothetical protein
VKSYKAKVPCHIGPVKVFSIGNTPVWGASLRQVNMCRNAGFILSLGVKGDNSKAVQGNLPELASLERGELTPQLLVTCLDFGVPTVGREWWEDFIIYIRGNEPKSLIIHCESGHGRTGVALAILYAITQRSRGCPVAAIRRKYCRDAVETPEQISYIEEVIGRPVKASPSLFNLE